MYVSAKFIEDPMTGSIDTLIEALDDQGRRWTVPGMDCDVGDWVEYLASGGTVEPYAPPPETKPAEPPA